MRLLVALLAAVLPSSRGHLGLELVQQWNELEFEFPTEADRDRFIANKLYVRGEALPMDFHYDTIGNKGHGRLFLTMPRQAPGRPIPWGTVTSTNAKGGPIIKPYPDFAFMDNPGTNCGGITSIYRMTVDSCGRMYVIDTGKIGATYYCPAKILAFDLETDTEVLRYQLPESVIRQNSILISPLIDVQSAANKCQSAFVYVADPPTYGLIVFDVAECKSWRIEHRYFYPYPTSGIFTITGESFELMLGILGMALYPVNRPATRLFFHALSSTSEQYVDTSVLKNATLWANTTNAAASSFIMLDGSRETQCAAARFDSKGRLYFGQNNPISLVRWQIGTPFFPKNFEMVNRNDKTLQFVAAMKVYGPPDNESVWILTTRYQKSGQSGYNPKEVNFRVMKANIIN